MNYYFKEENVRQYKEMTGDYDNSRVISYLSEFLPKGAEILELGMGTGRDLLTLSENYRVTGSDFSPLFVREFKKEHPETPVHILDARDFFLPRKFDCIYSNKVLYHLTAEELKTSLEVQKNHLKDGGIIFMTMWRGDFCEETAEDGLLFTYYKEEDIVKYIPAGLSVKEMRPYTEEEKDDSLVIVLQKCREE